MSQNVKKELYGAMFEIRVDKNGIKEALPTKDENKAAPILSLLEHRECPYCRSNKCLSNIVGESISHPEYFDPGVDDIRYVDIATCNKFKKDFLIGRSIKHEFNYADRALREKRLICRWCGSPKVARISNLKEARMSFFDPSKIAKYRLVVEGEYYAQMKGMTIDEFYLFWFKNPLICKQCRRITGYMFDDEGQKLLKELDIAVRLKELAECMINLGLDIKLMSFKGKCPLCSAKINRKTYENGKSVEASKTEREFAFTIFRYKCKKCQKEFYGYLDHYNKV